MKEADSKGVEIIIFPELSITAYTCGDLFSQQLLLDEALAALLEVTDASRQNQLVSIIGIPVEINGALLNCAAVIQNGRILGIVPKIYLPNYKEFYEMRWFASGKHYQTTISLGEQKNIPVSPYLLHIFEDTYLNRAKPLNVVEAHFAQVNGITATVTLELNGQRKVVTSVGNGRLDAVANAIQSATGMDFHLENYSEHSLDEGSTSRAASYVGLVWGDNTVTWGAGTDTDIIVAGIRALVSAINNK